MKRKPDTRMAQAIERINEHNERRAELIRSGQGACHHAWFDKWEAEQLVRRHEFEKKLWS